MLTNEHDFLHAVSILFIPVGTQGSIAFHHLCQLFLGHGGKPLACLSDADLLACLLEEVTHVHLVLEVADAFGADDALRPFAGYEFIEESEVEGATTVIEKVPIPYSSASPSSW